MVMCSTLTHAKLPHDRDTGAREKTARLGDI
jgi:hypothetical protein